MHRGDIAALLLTLTVACSSTQTPIQQPLPEAPATPPQPAVAPPVADAAAAPPAALDAATGGDRGVMPESDAGSTPGDAAPDAPPEHHHRTAGGSGRAAADASTPSTATVDGPAVARGARVFQRQCDSCHPGAEADHGPRLRGRSFDEVRLVAQVRNGSRGMRAIPPARLPDGQMRDLVAYLRSIDAVR